MENLAKELSAVLNRNSVENNSDTPDFILAVYLVECLRAFEKATILRTNWYNSDALKLLNKDYEQTIQHLKYELEQVNAMKNAATNRVVSIISVLLITLLLFLYNAPMWMIVILYIVVGVIGFKDVISRWKGE